MTTKKIAALAPGLYPNEWRSVRKKYGLSQRDVAHYLGHLNVDYYQDIEAGRRFPHARILAVLTALFRVELPDAYPELVEHAKFHVATIRERSTLLHNLN